MSGPQTFTPQQVLDAGRRAEREGRRDYAIQFYRHLIEHFNDAPEAMEAHIGLSRLAGRGGARSDGGAEPRSGRHPPASPGPYDADAGQSRVNGAATPHHREHRTETPPPPARAPVRRGYGMGRLFALLIVAAGVLQTLTSLAFLALAAAARLGRPIELPEAVPAVDGGYLGAMLAGGIVLIVFGAVARAVFDGADALRHLTGRDGPR